jgi:hypothetical protein
MVKGKPQLLIAGLPPIDFPVVASTTESQHLVWPSRHQAQFTCVPTATLALHVCTLQSGSVSVPWLMMPPFMIRVPPGV